MFHKGDATVCRGVCFARFGDRQSGVDFYLAPFVVSGQKGNTKFRGSSPSPPTKSRRLEIPGSVPKCLSIGKPSWQKGKMAKRDGTVSGREGEEGVDSLSCWPSALRYPFEAGRGVKAWQLGASEMVGAINVPTRQKKKQTGTVYKRVSTKGMGDVWHKTGTSSRARTCGRAPREVRRNLAKLGTTQTPSPVGSRYLTSAKRVTNSGSRPACRSCTLYFDRGLTRRAVLTSQR
jgi:hypothetical protein